MQAALFESFRKHVPRQTRELDIYWNRFGGRPDFTGARVLDFGSSIGVGCFDALERGAARVVGVEIDLNLLAFSQARAADEYARYAKQLTLTSEPLSSFEAGGFDYVLSKDVFEHVQSDGGLATVLREMYARLVPGGTAYLGWGPLYFSPKGGHGLSQIKLGERALTVPWMHVLLPEPLLMTLYNRTRGEHVESISAYGLNRLRYADYERAVRESPFEIVSYAVNVTDHPLQKVVSRAIDTVPLLRDYLTSTIYCVLRRPA